MAYKNNKISAPVSTDDVKKALELDSHDIGTLCMSEKIDRWAINKPVKHESPIWTPDTCKGLDGNYGLYVPSYTDTVSSLIENISDFTAEYYQGSDAHNGWKYIQVEDGDWCRLDDFNGYSPTALPPYTNGPASIIEVQKEDQATISITSNIGFADTTISLSDLKDFEGKAMYFGILLYGIREGKNISRIITGDQNLLSMRRPFSPSISFPNPSEFTKGTYTIYPLLCSMPNINFNITETEAELMIVPIPTVSPISYEVKENASDDNDPIIIIIITNTSVVPQIGGGYNISCTVKNVASFAVKITKAKAHFYTENDILLESYGFTGFPADGSGKTIYPQNSASFFPKEAKLETGIAKTIESAKYCKIEVTLASGSSYYTDKIFIKSIFNPSI